ncbi:MAG: hypothetical protein JHC71_06740 [Blastococcus sp.]|nr:hypothetical protein [Blastococcus sp.]
MGSAVTGAIGWMILCLLARGLVRPASQAAITMAWWRPLCMTVGILGGVLVLATNGGEPA